MAEKNEVVIDGVKYVRADSVACTGKRETLAGKKYTIVRARSAGVFAGHFKGQKGNEVVLQDARRLWYWDGAASLSQLAMEGTSKPSNCKFPIAVDEVHLLDVIEMIPCTAKGEASIKGVPVWKK